MFDVGFEQKCSQNPCSFNGMLPSGPSKLWQAHAIGQIPIQNIQMNI